MAGILAANFPHHECAQFIAKRIHEQNSTGMEQREIFALGFVHGSLLGALI
jgi:hypothetical protein